mmetsp:Transcript_5043/g.12670  ORF Transcript_5043/g.12670 Transcript_5043/m.12670 type:complete len:235 (-) Transcript_5043:129-833(-)
MAIFKPLGPHCGPCPSSSMIAMPLPPTLADLIGFPLLSKVKMKAEMASRHSPYPSQPRGLYPPKVVPLFVTPTSKPAPWPSSCLWKAAADQPWTLASYARPSGSFSICVCFKRPRTFFSSVVSSLSKGATSKSSVTAGHWSGHSSFVIRFSPKGSGSSSTSLPNILPTRSVMKSRSGSSRISSPKTFPTRFLLDLETKSSPLPPCTSSSRFARSLLTASLLARAARGRLRLTGA